MSETMPFIDLEPRVNMADCLGSIGIRETLKMLMPVIREQCAKPKKQTKEVTKKSLRKILVDQ